MFDTKISDAFNFKEIDRLFYLLTLSNLNKIAMDNLESKIRKQILDITENEKLIEIFDEELKENKNKLLEYESSVKEYEKNIEELHTNIDVLEMEKVSTFSSNDELKDGVWIDPYTNLMWSRICIGQSWVNGGRSGNPKELTWDEACSLTKSFLMAGYSDWRLPTIDELRTLTNTSKAHFKFIEHILVGLDSDPLRYWSCSEYNGLSNYAWIVYFSIDNGAAQEKKNSYYARLVRNI